MKIKKIFTISLAGLLFFPLAALAEDVYGGIVSQLAPFAINSYGRYTVEGGSPVYYVSIILNSILGIMGIVFTIIVIYAGWQWLTAAGNEEQIKKAKQWLINSIIGIIIILAAFVISNFIITSLLQAQQYETIQKKTLFNLF